MTNTAMPTLELPSIRTNGWLFVVLLGTLILIMAAAGALVISSLFEEGRWTQAELAALRTANALHVLRHQSGQFPSELNGIIDLGIRHDYQTAGDGFRLTVYLSEDGYECVTIDSRGNLTRDE